MSGFSFCFLQSPFIVYMYTFCFNLTEFIPIGASECSVYMNAKQVIDVRFKEPLS